MTQATITALFRYPVKGLSPERLAGVALTAGAAIAWDRAYAIENGPGAFDEMAPRHLPKIAFLCLMRDERLALIQSTFAPETATLTLAREGQILAAGDLRTLAGRRVIEAVIAREMATELRGAPRVVSAPGHSFSDVREKCLHIVNLASVRALEVLMGRRIDPLRFRPNVVVDGMEAFGELDLVGRDIRIGGAKLSVFKRTVRCAATNVDPVSGARDADIPQALFDATGHRDFGIYATVAYGGIMREGDALSMEASD